LENQPKMELRTTNFSPRLPGSELMPEQPRLDHHQRRGPNVEVFYGGDVWVRQT
jgi:hypothetical protein